MNVNNYAKKFIKEYDVKKLDIYILKAIISKLGYKLIEYSPLFNNDYVDTIIEGLKLDKELENRCCFTYKNEYMNYIFVREGMNEQELIPLLLHEIGHIYIKHIDNSVIKNSISLECEAEEFTFKVRSFVNQNRIKRKALYIVPTFLMSTLIVTAVALNFKDNKSDMLYYQEPSGATTEQTTEPITEHSEGCENLYYVSSSGRKYHLKDCYQINPDNCTALSLEKVVEIGYTPCKTCKPDKQD